MQKAGQKHLSCSFYMQDGKENLEFGSVCWKKSGRDRAANDVCYVRHGRESKKSRDGVVNRNLLGCLACQELTHFLSKTYGSTDYFG